MDPSTLHRRAFHKLTLAAFSGLVAGMTVGCRNGPAGGGDTGTPPDEKNDPLLQDLHICRGLNTCQGKGKDGQNNCAGQGSCAIAAAHTCKGDNDCKGQGGCGEHPGENSCKGKGSCNVPLKDKTWTIARHRFEELMTKAGKKFGEAPPKKA